MELVMSGTTCPCRTVPSSTSTLFALKIRHPHELQRGIAHQELAGRPALLVAVQAAVAIDLRRDDHPVSSGKLHVAHPADADSRLADGCVAAHARRVAELDVDRISAAAAGGSIR